MGFLGSCAHGFVLPLMLAIRTKRNYPEATCNYGRSLRAVLDEKVIADIDQVVQIDPSALRPTCLASNLTVLVELHLVPTFGKKRLRSVFQVVDAVNIVVNPLIFLFQ